MFLLIVNIQISLAVQDIQVVFNDSTVKSNSDIHGIRIHTLYILCDCHCKSRTGLCANQIAPGQKVKSGFLPKCNVDNSLSVCSFFYSLWFLCCGECILFLGV